MKTEISELSVVDTVGLSMALMVQGYEDIFTTRNGNGQVFLNFWKLKKNHPVFIDHREGE